ncbi:hypothetical protein ON010_g16226 [Phytophthora cinnamomi]|nr:hypothetical protein ON010_g16226 [Phytophthora cinnamomi]
MKERYTVNPFPELALSEADKASLQDLSNDYIVSNLDLCMKFMNSGRKVNPRRWKPLKEKEGLKVYSERRKSVGLATADEATGAGLPTILCVGTKEGKLDDLMFGIISEDLETMRLKASYADSFSAAAVLDGVVMPTVEDPFRSLVVKWMELDIPFKSTGLVKNRDYVYVEGIGIVKNAAGERFGYSLLHSVNFPSNPLTSESSARQHLVHRVLAPDEQQHHGDVRDGDHRPGGRRDQSQACASRSGDPIPGESRTRGAPNKSSTCVTCTSPVGGRRLGDFDRQETELRGPGLADDAAQGDILCGLLQGSDEHERNGHRPREVTRLEESRGHQLERTHRLLVFQ